MIERKQLAPDIWLDLMTAKLYKENGAIALTPRAFALLRYLVTHPNEILSTQNLLEALWPNRYVNDSEVRHYIRELRQALEDNHKVPRFIETVHGKGYRFISTLPNRIPASSAYPSLISVGRLEEQEQLHRWLSRSLAGRLQVVLIEGEAGIGKTTLMYEFEQSLRGRDDVRVVRGQCVETYGQGEPFMLILAALEILCRGTSGTQVKDCLEYYAPLWFQQLPDLFGSVDLPELRDRTQDASPTRMLRELAQALEMLTIESGLVLWLEDLHWADTATLSLVDYLVRYQSRMRLLLIGTCRPLAEIGNLHPLQHLVNELRFHQNCHELVLAPFDPETVGKFLEKHFPGLPPALATCVHQHTGGNPLFISNVMEDLRRRDNIVLTERGWTLNGELNTLVLGIPENLRRMIAQRLGQLSDEERRLLTAASAAGAKFSAAVLAAALNWDVTTVEEFCIGLVRRNCFLHRIGDESWPDGSVSGRYTFSHALYRQALYEQMTPCRRQEIHRLLGMRLEKGYLGHIKEIAAKLAIHFGNGGDIIRSILYHKIAAQVALQRRAMCEACIHLEKALSWLKYLPIGRERDKQELELLVALGYSLTTTSSWASPVLERTYSRACELCLQLDDERQLFTVLQGLWACQLLRANYRAADEAAAKLFAIAEQRTDEGLYLEAHIALGLTRLWTARFDDVREQLDHVLFLYDPDRYSPDARAYGQDARVLSLIYRAWLNGWLGFPGRAEQDIANGISEGHKSGNAHSLVFAMVYRLVIDLNLRDAQSLRRNAEQAVRMASDSGFDQWLMIARFFDGWARVLLGEGEAGITQMQECFAEYRNTGARLGDSFFLTLLAEVHALTGRSLRGLVMIDEALAMAADSGEGYYKAEIHRIKGELLRSIGNDAQAEEYFRLALNLARKQRAQAWELRSASSMAQLWIAHGKRQEAYELLSEVYASFTDGFDTADLIHARMILYELERN